jgi:hypothetical protein
MARPLRTFRDFHRGEEAVTTRRQHMRQTRRKVVSVRRHQMHYTAAQRRAWFGKRMGGLEYDTLSKQNERDDARRKPIIEKMVSYGGWHASAGGEWMYKDLKRAKEYWARYVKDETGGKLVGEIRDYNREPGPPCSGDMRDTWSLCLLDKAGNVVDYHYVNPWADEEEIDPEWFVHTADRVLCGEISQAAANSIALGFYNEMARSEATNEIEMIADSLRFDEMFPKATAFLGLTEKV